MKLKRVNDKIVKKYMIHIWMDDDLHKRILNYCKEQCNSVSAVGRRLFIEAMKKNE